MTTARLRLAVAGQAMSSGDGDMLGETSRFPQTPSPVRFADKSLRDFPTPLHRHGPGAGP